MDLISLDDNYRADNLIENYESLIWTERQISPGDFTLQTPQIDKVMAQLPLDKIVSLMDTLEVMTVEDHKITKNDSGIYELTVTGRSFETILENRAAADNVTDPTPNEWQITNTSPGAAAVYAIREQIINSRSSGNDDYPNVDAFYDPATPDDPSASHKYSMELKDLYSSVLDILKSSNIGIRTERILVPPDGDPPQLRIVVYTAEDHSVVGQLDQVIFSTSAGHFDDTSYLFSTRDKKNVAYVFSPADSARIAAEGHTTAEYTGFNRRVLVVEASDITKAKSGYTIAELLASRGQSELKKHQGHGIFTGTISINVPWRYKVDYDLGDRVTVKAEYGIEGDMRVTEYTRSQDAGGETGYPTLVQI